MAAPESSCQAPHRDPTLRDLGVFFVFGCQKSGTTWVQHLLNAHPNLCCGGEGHLADLLIPLLQQAVNVYNQRQAARSDPGLDVLLTEDDLLAAARTLGDRILSGYLRRLAGPSAIRAVGDKAPEYAIAIGPLNRLYPHSKYIHIIRDGRDAAASGWAHLQRQGKAGQFATFADYAAYFARHHWKPYITRARADGQSLSGRYLELRYEDLHADPIGPTRSMLEFLGVESDADAVAACVEGGSFERLSGGRSRGQEDARSFFRKGVVGDWREHFDEEAERAFAANSGDLLRQLGYERAPARAEA
ncbi:MAG: sulfotransferase [Phycisphaerales bacterium]|nr:MAG: sulfotransferase [Phycisphaerales bacterium]